MYDKFFGTYLLNQNIISPEELKKILAHMKEVHIKIGTLAIQEGLMNGKQVEEIVGLQKVQDRKFGELAVEKGYLEEKQLKDLLQTQSEESNLQLGQAAVDLGFLTYEQLEKELVNFARESGLSREQWEALQRGDHDEIIGQFLDFDGTSRPSLYYQYISLLLRNIVRFLDQQPWIEPDRQSEDEKQVNNMITVFQNLSNGCQLFTGILLCEETFMRVAEQFANMSVEGDTELAHASVLEFLNLHNGLFTVNMSNRGEEYHMEPPEITRENLEYRLKDAEAGKCIDIYTGLGKITLILAEAGRGDRSRVPPE